MKIIFAYNPRIQSAYKFHKCHDSRADMYKIMICPDHNFFLQEQQNALGLWAHKALWILRSTQISVNEDEFYKLFTKPINPYLHRKK